mmetsp:Transcript_42959/g.80536  ORF Transcript_42959/g.80536 Transcript_42959/m.80536 type:complete len:220 (+) Transcript_42959:1298-1957(+)
MSIPLVKGQVLGVRVAGQKHQRGMPPCKAYLADALHALGGPAQHRRQLLGVVGELLQHHPRLVRGGRGNVAVHSVLLDAVRQEVAVELAQKPQPSRGAVAQACPRNPLARILCRRRLGSPRPSHNNVDTNATADTNQNPASSAALAGGAFARLIAPSACSDVETTFSPPFVGLKKGARLPLLLALPLHAAVWGSEHIRQSRAPANAFITERIHRQRTSL